MLKFLLTGNIERLLTILNLNLLSVRGNGYIYMHAKVINRVTN